jgi:NADPH-dependent 2,4-dienoyl-CoA reductase/sulfur reductase-like enzyme
LLKKLGDNIYALVRKEVVPLMEADENLTIHLQTKVEEVLPGRLRAVTDAGAELFIDFDDLVMATGAKPHCDADEEALQGRVPLVVKIGDCKKRTARKMYEAVHEGYNAQ